MPKRINLSENAMAALSEMNTDFEGMENLMKDVALGREIEDNGRKISKAEANEMIHRFSLKVLDIEDPKNYQEVRRGKMYHGREWLDIIENTVEFVVSVGYQENEWFNQFVDKMTIGYKDRADFYSENDSILSIAKSGESHHDHFLQRIEAGQVVSIPTFRYSVKVGADINRYIAGEMDWAKLVSKIGEAFIQKTQKEAYDALDTAVTKLPTTTGFVGTGALSSSNKANFDAVIANVSEANGGADVAIFGTRTGLKSLNAITDVDWANLAQKDAMTNSGLLGTYEGTELVLLPQRFADRTYDVSRKLFNDYKLFIMPKLDNKIVKFVDEGVTEINEITEKGEQNGRWDDIMTYEVQRRMGVAVLVGRFFGQWTLRQ